MTEAKRVVVVGSLNYDILLGQTRLPSRGETLHCRQAATASGGKGANQAVQAAKEKLKAEKAAAQAEEAKESQP